MSTTPIALNNPFFNTSLDELLTGQQRGNAEEKVVQLFQRCCVEVPAYRQFLSAKQTPPANAKHRLLAYTALPILSIFL